MVRRESFLVSFPRARRKAAIQRCLADRTRFPVGLVGAGLLHFDKPKHKMRAPDTTRVIAEGRRLGAGETVWRCRSAVAGPTLPGEGKAGAPASHPSVAWWFVLSGTFRVV